MKRKYIVVALVILALLLVGCRNETQNRIRRNIQDFTSGRMYISLYTIEGVEVFYGPVDGKVTRASASLSGSSGNAAGSYVFWYDDRGRYHQSSLPYLVTTYDRNEEPASD